MTSNAATDVHFDGVDASSSSCSKAHFRVVPSEISRELKANSKSFRLGVKANN